MLLTLDKAIVDVIVDSNKLSIEAWIDRVQSQVALFFHVPIQLPTFGSIVTHCGIVGIDWAEGHVTAFVAIVVVANSTVTEVEIVT